MKLEDMVGKVIQGDCLDVVRDIPDKSIDLILTDPPYDDYYTDLYKQTDMSFLNKFKCRQLIFWSAKSKFPLDYTAIHIWDKLMGCASWYERIFERNGNFKYKVYRKCSINSSVAAKMGREVYTGYKSQKPIMLIQRLVLEYSKENDLILDPFLGSGTTAVACERLNRRWIGIEIEPSYVKTARERIKQEQDQIKLNI